MRTKGQKNILITGLVLGILILFLTLYIRQSNIYLSDLKVNDDSLLKISLIFITIRILFAIWVRKESREIGLNQWVWFFFTIAAPVLGMIIFGSYPFLSKLRNSKDAERNELLSLANKISILESEILSSENQIYKLKKSLDTGFVEEDNIQSKIMECNSQIRVNNEKIYELSNRRDAIIYLNIPLKKLSKLLKEEIIDIEEYKSKRERLILDSFKEQETKNSFN
jgi:hypothetical protein